MSGAGSVSFIHQTVPGKCVTIIVSPGLCPPGSLSTMSAARASNGVFVVIPPSNASGLRPPPATLSSSVCQPAGVGQLEEPPLGSPTPGATQALDLRPVETFLTGEPKALGVRTASPGDLRRRCWRAAWGVRTLERRQKAAKHLGRIGGLGCVTGKGPAPVALRERTSDLRPRPGHEVSPQSRA